MKAEIIFTGTELLLGQIVNTHAQYLGERLSALGIETTRQVTVGDDWEGITKALREALGRADLVIITGGLGPTEDDLTMAAVAEVLGRPLVLYEQALRRIDEYFAAQGRTTPPNVVKEAYLPEGAELLPNETGTAPGCLLEDKGKILVILPGPPRELQPMYEKYVEPHLRRKLGTEAGVFYYRVLKLTGISECATQEKLKDLAASLVNPRIGYIVKPGEVHIRVSATASTQEEARHKVEELLKRVEERVKDYVFAYDEEQIEEVVGRLLRDRGFTIGVAESCTGGLLGGRLTDVPGSSDYFLGGVIAYANEVKEQVLGVPLEVLRTVGAVSSQTAQAMAEGVKRLLGTTLGVGITGIAGPGGATPQKPVGLVYIALATPEGTEVKRFEFPGHRAAVRQGAVNGALMLVRRYLEKGI
ncbi:competence/damage-inducible protein A [Ammonifex thiophilus]|uniref:Putative competence-damage inducible protein n=1 Tax=Ammonifex thiophilus TaxID=444093 RepID=A0A3D8P3R8_9THEO|nr:competence/damage-inducible protein A [Ammonifex thiophilus]RDV81299.1 competence/damage-inducible protein A [Ammonifex thiophilus]